MSGAHRPLPFGLELHARYPVTCPCGEAFELGPSLAMQMGMNTGAARCPRCDLFLHVELTDANEAVVEPHAEWVMGLGLAAAPPATEAPGAKPMTPEEESALKARVAAAMGQHVETIERMPCPYCELVCDGKVVSDRASRPGELFATFCAGCATPLIIDGHRIRPWTTAEYARLTREERAQIESLRGHFRGQPMYRGTEGPWPPRGDA